QTVAEFTSLRDYRAGTATQSTTSLSSVVSQSSVTRDESSLSTMHSESGETRVSTEPSVLRANKDTLVGTDQRISTSVGTSVSASVSDSTQSVVRHSSESSYYGGASASGGIDYSSYAFDSDESSDELSLGTSLGCALSTTDATAEYA